MVATRKLAHASCLQLQPLPSLPSNHNIRVVLDGNYETLCDLVEKQRIHQKKNNKVQLDSYRLSIDIYIHPSINMTYNNLLHHHSLYCLIWQVRLEANTFRFGNFQSLQQPHLKMDPQIIMIPIPMATPTGSCLAKWTEIYRPCHMPNIDSPVLGKDFDTG